MNTRHIALMTLGGLALAGILSTAPPAAADSYDRYDSRYDSRWGRHDNPDIHFQRGARARIDTRQRLQEQRIQHGVNTGTLTRREFRILEQEQASIRQMEANALADRFLSRAEYREIDLAQDAAESHIERLNHNDRVARYQGNR